VVWATPVEQTPHYVGRGRGSWSRAKRVIAPTRSQRTHSARQEDPLATRRPRFGGQALVTNAGHTRRSLPEAVWGSRNASRVERLGKRLKSRGHLAPLLVKLHEHLEGLPYLRTLGVRVGTVPACVLRWSWETTPASLPR
jgi:hypothetical protein